MHRSNPPLRLNNPDGCNGILRKFSLLNDQTSFAIVASLAALRCTKFLAKIAKNFNPSAIRLVVTKCRDTVEHRHLALLLLIVALTISDQLLQDPYILLAIEKNAIGGIYVSACATRLLIVSFRGFWKSVVYDKPHVWLVDAHAERNCCNDNLDLALLPGSLYLNLLLGVEACVVVPGGDSLDQKTLRNFLCVLSCDRVDNPTLIRTFGFDQRRDLVHTFGIRCLSANLVV